MESVSSVLLWASFPPAVCSGRWLTHLLNPLLQACQCMCQERIDEAGHGHLQALSPLVEIANVLISNLWLIESTLRHRCPPLGCGIMTEVCRMSHPRSRGGCLRSAVRTQPSQADVRQSSRRLPRSPQSHAGRI